MNIYGNKCVYQSWSENVFLRNLADLLKFPRYFFSQKKLLLWTWPLKMTNNWLVLNDSFLLFWISNWVQTKNSLPCCTHRVQRWISSVNTDDTIGVDVFVQITKCICPNRKMYFLYCTHTGGFRLAHYPRSILMIRSAAMYLSK